MPTQTATDAETKIVIYVTIGRADISGSGRSENRLICRGLLMWIR